MRCLECNMRFFHRIGCSLAPAKEVPDESIDTSEIPELDGSFFENAKLVRPGESLIDAMSNSGLYPAWRFLSELTRCVPPSPSARHSLVVEDDGQLCVNVLLGSTWRSFTVEAADLNKNAEELVADLVKLLAQKKDVESK